MRYSTDYVFDGSGYQPWRESESTVPLNVYGHSELEGENRIAALCGKHLILRTGWVYSAGRGNFAKTMLRLAAERERLSVVNDQFGAPTGADLLAGVMAHLTSAVRHCGSMAGVYLLAAAGETS